MIETSFKNAFKIFLMGGCVVGFSQAATAQDNLAIISNSAQIEQIGTGNIALINANSQNSVQTLQSGQNNNVSLTVEGFANGDGVETLTVEQTGGSNNTTAVILGNENRLFVTQSSGGAVNNGLVNQDGDFNSATLTQEAAGLLDGFANQAEINQIGQSNTVNIAQTSFVAGDSVFNNTALVNQTGDDNIATVSQFGINNISEQEQVGDRNTSEIIQTGNDNLAIHRQFGNDFNVPLEQGGLIIEQTGGASIIIEQYSPSAATPIGP